MHLENLVPLMPLWPLVALLLAGLGMMFWHGGCRRRGEARQKVDRDRRYWAAEFAYRARMRAKEWLTRTKTPRLTYQGPPLEVPAQPSERR